jgi:hypothetical protein
MSTPIPGATAHAVENNVNPNSPSKNNRRRP